MVSDSRRWLLQQLEAYAAKWPGESAIQEIVAFVRRQTRCFERDCFQDGHVTGSAWVMSPERDRVLLTHHAKLDKWLQLGGHSDGQSNTLQVALREAEEESGLRVSAINESVFDVDVHEIPARGAEPVHRHYDVRFALVADDSRNPTVSEESKDLRWVSIQDVSMMTSEESMLRMVRKTEALNMPK